MQTNSKKRVWFNNKNNKNKKSEKIGQFCLLINCLRTDRFEV